jgi:GTPase involved in cell partitioning and DNA repair
MASAGDPGDGADGADVVLVCDPRFDNLLHLHRRKMHTAPKGAAQRWRLALRAQPAAAACTLACTHCAAAA